MNWIKPKGKKPSNYLDSIKHSLGFSNARNTIVGNDSSQKKQALSIQDSQETSIAHKVIDAVESQGNPKSIKVNESPVNETPKESDVWEFPSKPVKSKWELKLKRVLSKQSSRVQPHTPPFEQQKQEPSFVSIFDQVSLQIQQHKQSETQSERTVLVELKGEQKGEDSDQTVPEHQPKTVISDSESSETASHSEKSRVSLERVHQSKNDIELVPDTPIKSLEFNATQAWGDAMRASNSIELIPSTPFIKSNQVFPTTPKKRKTPEAEQPKIQLRYSPSEDQTSPICCSNKVVTDTTSSPKKKLKSLRLEIDKHLDFKFNEIKTHLHKLFQDYEAELKSPEEDDYAGLFTPGCEVDPFE